MGFSGVGFPGAHLVVHGSLGSANSPEGDGTVTAFATLLWTLRSDAEKGLVMRPLPIKPT